jgi:hypothetical protein
MTYTPNPTDPTNPTTSVAAGTMAAEFQALKLYVKQVLAAGTKRNLLINGAMNIDQVNGGSAYALGAGTTQYTIDGWAVTTAGGTGCTVQQATGGPIAYNNCLQIVNSASASCTLFQRIEAANTQSMLSGTIISVSGWIYCSSSAANFTSLSTVGTGTAITLTAGSFIYFSQQITLTGGCSYGAQLTFNTANGGGVTFEFTQIQLEVNNFSTPYEYITPSADLLNCQRYFIISVFGTQQYGVAGEIAEYTNTIPVSMFKPTPTATILYSYFTNCGSPTVTIGSYSNCPVVEFQVTVAATGNFDYQVTVTLNARL